VGWKHDPQRLRDSGPLGGKFECPWVLAKSAVGKGCRKPGGNTCGCSGCEGISGVRRWQSPEIRAGPQPIPLKAFDDSRWLVIGCQQSSHLSQWSQL
jgi:hypothetical protein